MFSYVFKLQIAVASLPLYPSLVIGWWVGLPLPSPVLVLICLS